jgi:hypothetical protein
MGLSKGLGLLPLTLKITSTAKAVNFTVFVSSLLVQKKDKVINF